MWRWLLGPGAHALRAAQAAGRSGAAQSPLASCLRSAAARDAPLLARAVAQGPAAAGGLLAGGSRRTLWGSAAPAWRALFEPAGARCFATNTQRKAAANPGLKYWKPTTPGQRGRVTIRRTGIWRGGPLRALARGGGKAAGRNHSGRITVWHRGGGARKVVREVDMRRRRGTPDGVVERLEYDPGRTAYIALVRHASPDHAALGALESRAAALRPAGGGIADERAATSSSGGSSSGGSSSGGGGSSGGGSPEYLEAVAGLLQQLQAGQAAARRAARGAAGAAGGGGRPYSYIVAPQELRPGDSVSSRDAAPIQPGNMLRLRDIPVGMPMHNLELRPGKGASLCRAAGCVATIVNKQETHAIVRLPSGEQRLFPMECRATVGAVSNPQHKNRVIGKAGYARHQGRRPIVRGVAMNPVDHPHGGGTAGGRPSVTPWGIPCKGFRTRRHSPNARWILVTRRRGKQAAGAGAAGPLP